jgi:hypothetical protein
MEAEPESDEATQPLSVTELEEVVWSRLLPAIDREMAALSRQLPRDQSRLGPLHRSLRYALPRLIRMRLAQPVAPDTSEHTDPSDETPQ